MEPVTVFIMDQNRMVRHALARHLSITPNIRILGSAGNPDEAEFLTERLQPDVVVVEPKRLNPSRIRFLQHLLEASYKPDIIILTSFYDENEASFLRQMGITSYFLKDTFDTTALMNYILGRHLDFIRY